MNHPIEYPPNPDRRRTLSIAAAMLGTPWLPNDAAPASAVGPAPRQPPTGYNILFVLTDQERHFDAWPFPAPARQWLASRGVTFTNHQAASAPCSPARSTLYTGQHTQRTGVFDNVRSPWQAPLPPSMVTLGHRLAALGYHPAYFGKWHLCAEFGKTEDPCQAPLAELRGAMQSYGFQDYLGFGDGAADPRGGFANDDTTVAFATNWMRTTGLELTACGRPWYMAVNLLNPHDIMFLDADAPGDTTQARSASLRVAPPPLVPMFGANWSHVPLPVSRHQPFDAPGRPAAHAVYQAVHGRMTGVWPNDDRRCRLQQDFYFNCIRDSDTRLQALLDALRATGLERRTIVVFSSDHGELGGAHGMRDKGTCAYREQNHLPLVIVHPAYPGGGRCAAVTSQVDLAPTFLALTGAAPDALAKAASGLPGQDLSPLLTQPASAKPDELRPAALFSYDSLLTQDAAWHVGTPDTAHDKGSSPAQRRDWMRQHPPDLRARCALRSVFDGRYRFSRYFSPLAPNTPRNWEQLAAANDLELYDLADDPAEMRNLAAEGRNHRDLLLAMNDKLNARLDEEVGDDDGRLLPLRGGRLVVPDA